MLVDFGDCPVFMKKQIIEIYLHTTACLGPLVFANCDRCNSNLMTRPKTLSKSIV